MGNLCGERSNLQGEGTQNWTEGLLDEGLYEDELNSEDVEDSFDTQETDLNPDTGVAGKSCGLRIDNVRTLSSTVPPTADSSKPLLKLAVELPKPFVPTDGLYRVDDQFYIVVSQGQCKCQLCGRTSIDFQFVLNHIRGAHKRLGATPKEFANYPQLGRRRSQPETPEKVPEEPKKRIPKKVREHTKNSDDWEVKKPKVPKTSSRPRQQAKSKGTQAAEEFKKKSPFVPIEEGKYLYLEKYEVTRSEEGRFVCQTCGYSSVNSLHVCTHIRDKHVVNPENEQQWRSRRRPKWKETSPGKYTDGKFSIEKQEDGSFKCLECGKVGRNRYSVQIHVGMMHSQGIIICA